MSNNPVRIPLHLQNTDIAKAAAEQRSASYESFRPNQVLGPQYKEMEDRPTTHMMATIRRYPSGELDYDWAMNAVIDAIHKAEYNGHLTPVEEALLTVIFPVKFPIIEPQMAEIRTQFSKTEKEKVATLVGMHMKAEAGWNAGFGGGAVPGAMRNNNGG